MPLGLFTMVAIYLTTWWIVLFMVLPIGMGNQVGEPPTDGSQWGAPANPNLKKKFLITTIASTVVWAIIIAVIWTGVIKLPAIDQSSLPAL